MQFGIPNVWGRGNVAKASLEITDLISFPVYKSSTNQLQEQEC